MGEYVKHKDTGEHIKIGTCENMWYTSYEAMYKELPLLEWLDGNLEPKDYFNYPEHTYWRFPFLDEKDAQFGDVRDYSKSHTFTINHYFACTLLAYNIEEADSFTLSISQQKVVGDYLMPAFTITGDNRLWVCENKDDVDSIIHAIKSCNDVDADIEAFCNQLEYYSTHKISELNIEQSISDKTNLLSLFDEIEIKKEQTISDEDLQRCAYLEQLANNTLQQLSKWNKVFSDALPGELEDNDFFKVGDYRIEKKSYYAESDIDKFNEFKFTPLYDIKHIKGLWHSTLHRFENMIVNYFNDKYNLRFKSLNIIGDKELGYMANYKEILDYIIKLLDGRTFEDMQHEYTLSDFRKEVRYNPEIKKNTITFNSFCEYRYDDKIKALCKAIGYFEGITIVETRDLISEWNDSRYMLGNTYNLPTNKAVSLKLYQNGRLDLKFTDGQ